VWKAFELTGDEHKFKSEIKEVMARIDELEKRKAELERRIELSHQAEADINGIQEFCELARYNLGNFSFPQKRIALEALKVRVTVKDGNLRLEGVIPIVSKQSVCLLMLPSLLPNQPIIDDITRHKQRSASDNVNSASFWSGR